MSLLLTLNSFHTLLWRFYCWLWPSKCRLGSDKKIDSMVVKMNVRVHISGKKCYQRIWSHLLTKSLMENFFFFAVYAFRLQNDLFTVSLNLKRICNSNNTMKKRNVACLKMNRFFKNYSFQHKRKLVLEKTLEQGVSKVYSQILENACQTSLVFFCAWSSSNTCVTRPMHVAWHSYLYEELVWKCKPNEKLRTDCESYKLYHTNCLT